MADGAAGMDPPTQVTGFRCRWAPPARVVIVMSVVALCSVASHIGIARALEVPPGQTPTGQGFGLVLYGPVLATIAAGVLFAVMGVGRAWAVWLPGAPLGLVSLGLTAYLLSQAGAGSWARSVGVPELTPFVIGNSLAVALSF